MFPVLLLGLGVGLVLAGLILLVSSFTHQRRMRTPTLIRWAGAVVFVVGFLAGAIALLWR